MNDLSEQIDQVDEEISSYNKEIDDLKTNIEDINDNISSLNYTISKAKEDLDMKNNFTNLRFYVIHQEDDNVYEIALPAYDYYYGAYPSDKHAILITKDISFTSKGWANMDVYNAGKLDVKLKEEYGSFTQKWNTYVQVSQEDKETINSLKSQISGARSKIEGYNKQIQNLNNQISAITNNKIKPLNAKKSKLLDTKKGLNDENINIAKEIGKYVKVTTEFKTISNSETFEKPNNDNVTKSNNISSTDFTYETYYNDSYKFSIKYPTNLTKKQLPENGDGVVLSSEDNKVRLTVFGINNLFNSTAESEYKNFLEKNIKVAYKRQSGNWFVISYTDGDKIIYEKEVVGKGSINIFIFEYPSDQKVLYDKVVEELNKSFSTPSVDEAH